MCDGPNKVVRSRDTADESKRERFVVGFESGDGERVSYQERARDERGGGGGDGLRDLREECGGSGAVLDGVCGFVGFVGSAAGALCFWDCSGGRWGERC